MRIKEIVYLTQEAKYGIWNYISAHFSMVNQVEGANYSGQPIAFEFEDSEIEETIKTYYMARIVDVKPFLEEYPDVYKRQAPLIVISTAQQAPMSGL